MITRIEARRRMANRLMQALCGGAAFFATAILFVLVLRVLVNGISDLRLGLLTEMPTPMGMPGGGIAHAVMGSVIMVGLACLWGIPLGIGCGIWLSEYAGARTGTAVRFVADVLAGVPSIVIGIFAYTLLVRGMGNFSAVAGAFALGVITLPIVARTAEETLRLVPHELREASLALGVPRWRSIVSVVMPTASVGLVTASILALARIAGETAPLIFTALGNNFWATDLSRPMAAMTLTIFQYAIWPYTYLHAQAWAASFFLLLFVLGISLVARLAAARRFGA